MFRHLFHVLTTVAIGTVGCAFLAGPLTGRASAMDNGTGPNAARPGIAAQDGGCLSEIRVPAGFVVELAAGPPLVQHPTFATLDDRGRLFVSENAGVNRSAAELEESLPNSVRLLEDTDQDGRFDKSTVFADKMTFPMGGAWYRGALYVASPPHIWRLEDTDGDGIADRRDVLVGKFGYTGNAASIHGCILGPDGRLYWCDGYHGHEFRDEAGRVTSRREGSYIFSCLANGSDVRIHCGGGMDNPVEVDFMETGEMLGTVNILYTRPRIDCLVHWLYGGVYPHREKVLAELKVTGDLLGPVHHFGHVAISGTQRYRSGVLDPHWRESFFATFFNSGKVVRVELEREGATFRATQREFLSCTNRDFHPTDIAEDADGSLLVVDTGGWFYRGCPTSQFAKPEVRGAIYRVRRQEAKVPADPRGRRIDWPSQSDSQLVALLGDSRPAVRERAIAECAARGEAIVAELRQVLEQGDTPSRLAAVWALTRMIGDASPSTASAEKVAGPGQAANPDRAAGAVPIRAAIRQALDNPEAPVRLAACRSLATYPDPAAVGRLGELLRQGEPATRREAAAALGRAGDARGVAELLEALSRSGSRTEEHALVFALIEINDVAATRAGLAANNPNTQRGALVALDQMDAGNLTAEDVLPLVAAADAELGRAAAETFARHPDWVGKSATVIARLLERTESSGQTAAVIRKLTTRSLADEAAAEVVGRWLAEPRVVEATRDLLLAAIADGQSVPLHNSWVQPLEQLLGSGDPATVERVLAAVGAIKTDRFQKHLEKLGTDPARPALLRVAALEAAAGRRGGLTDRSLALLIELLEGVPAEGLRAAQRIGAASLTKPQLLLLAPRLTTAGPSQLRELVRPYYRTSDAEVATAFLSAMEHARGLTSLAPYQLSDAILHYPRELLPAANQLLDRIRAEEQHKLDRLDKLLPLLAQGDAGRGRELFFAEKSKCGTCHAVANQGGRIGPDLTTIGANRSPQDLLESIVFPSATIVRDYEPYTAVTRDGRAFSGLIARESGDTVFLQQQAGDPVPLPRGDLEELAPSPVSIMPSGLDQDFRESELADLIAYLSSLRADPPVAQIRLPAGQDRRVRE